MYMPLPVLSVLRGCFRFSDQLRERALIVFCGDGRYTESFSHIHEQAPAQVSAHDNTVA